MIQQDPERRPSCDELLTHPQIQIRVKEIKLKNYRDSLKKKEYELSKRIQAIKEKESEISKRQQEQKEKEERLKALEKMIEQ